MPAKHSDFNLQHISKSFGENRVLKAVDISLGKGDVYALIGPNGSGKTTLVKIMVGLLDADTGSVDLMGHNIDRDPLGAKKSFGYISDGPLGYDYLTGEEFLALAASLRGIPPRDAKHQIEDLKKIFPIQDVLQQQMAHYSRGSLQKVALLAALLNSPQLLIVDEPIVGLDPDSVAIFGDRLTSFAKAGGTVFFVTHMLSFAQKYATRFGLLLGGALVAEGDITPRLNLEHLYKQKTWHG